MLQPSFVDFAAAADTAGHDDAVVVVVITAVACNTRMLRS